MTSAPSMLGGGGVTPANRRTWTLAAMCSAFFMVMLDNTVVNVSLPAIQRSFDAKLPALEWIVNAYTLCFAVLLITGGRLGDVFGRRRVFVYGVAVFTCASTAATLAPDPTFLVGSRALQGIGAAFMVPATLSIITNAFPAAERGRAIGTCAGVSAVALAIGPLVGGALTDQLSWRAIFLLNLPIGAITIAVTLLAATESRDETAARRIDRAGLVILTAGLTALILVLMEGKFWGWGSTETLVLLAFSTLGLAFFVVLEASSRAPMVDFVSFRSGTFLGANAIAFLVSFAMMSVFFFLPLYLQNVLGYSPLDAGVRFLPCALMVALIAPLAGRLADRVPPRVLIAGGMLLVTTALLWLARISVETSYGWLLVGFVVIGAGIALVMSPMSTAAMNAVDPQKAGAASGMLSMSRMIGGTFGVAALGALVATLGRERLDVLLPALSPERREALAAVLGGDTTGGGQIARGVRDAFVAALATGLEVTAALAALGALIALAFIKHAPARTSPGAPQPPADGTAPQTDLTQAGDATGVT